MTDISQYKDWELNEAEIDKAIHILKVSRPDIPATPENAIDFLEFLRTEVHILGHNATDEELKKLYDKYSKKSPKE
jgi:hypothetical protein